MLRTSIGLWIRYPVAGPVSWSFRGSSIRRAQETCKKERDNIIPITDEQASLLKFTILASLVQFYALYKITLPIARDLSF